MTRKDYILIAHAMNGSQLAQDATRHSEQYAESCKALADILQFYNPNFVKGTFLAACGLQPGAPL